MPDAGQLRSASTRITTIDDSCSMREHIAPDAAYRAAALPSFPAAGVLPAPIDMTDIVTLPQVNWDQPCSAAEQQEAIAAIESGKVILFPQLDFPLEVEESRICSSATTGDAKNISFDPVRRVLRGGNTNAAELNLLEGMMTRFAALSGALVGHLFPRYVPSLQQARTSFRPVEIAGRPSSWRKDDTRLHVDSFPSSPTQGRRILRLFCNVNPAGVGRMWRLGEPFEEVARRYVPSIPKPVRGVSLALDALGITKTRRSPYDHYMLQLHDRMKADLPYQSAAKQLRHEFPAGSTWLVYTDQVSHAAMSGQYLLEQTFHLPVDAMLDPSQSPLRILERLLGQRLA